MYLEAMLSFFTLIVFSGESIFDRFDGRSQINKNSFGGLHGPTSGSRSTACTKAYNVFGGKQMAATKIRFGQLSRTTTILFKCLPFNRSNENSQMGTCPLRIRMIICWPNNIWLKHLCRKFEMVCDFGRFFFCYISLLFSLSFCYRSGHFCRLPFSWFM